MEPNKKSEKVDKFTEIYKETEKHSMKLYCKKKGIDKEEKKNIMEQYSAIVKKDICSGMKRLSSAYSIFLKNTKQPLPSFSKFVKYINRQIFKNYNLGSLYSKNVAFAPSFKPVSYIDYEEKVQDVTNNEDIYKVIVQKSMDECEKSYSSVTFTNATTKQLILDGVIGDLYSGMCDLNKAYSNFIDKYRNVHPTFSMFVDSILRQSFKGYNIDSLANETAKLADESEQKVEPKKGTTGVGGHAFSGQQKEINNKDNKKKQNNKNQNRSPYQINNIDINLPKEINNNDNKEEINNTYHINGEADEMSK